MKLYITLQITKNINSENHKVIGVYKDYNQAKKVIELNNANDIVEVDFSENNIDSVLLLFYRTSNVYLSPEQDRYVGCFLNQKEIDSFLKENKSLYGQYLISEVKII